MRCSGGGWSLPCEHVRCQAQFDILFVWSPIEEKQLLALPSPQKRARRTLNRPPSKSVQRATTPDTDHTPDLNDHPDRQMTAKKTELPVFKEEKSRYVCDEASVALGQKIPEPRDIIESSSDEEL
ncbi:Fungal transcriptional regulatory protein, N-terminal [Penicillium digitatum]|uniref:Fungal transcriptional regulatory protein, N-terminal n=1 Tax=Penicillium digitatum TaxID=36651 RepID=A0A7T6XSG3_PENDI|nr:Fungal transcriptional regulatory protein, N-terminal [Penicillium digitatum]